MGIRFLQPQSCRSVDLRCFSIPVGMEKISVAGVDIIRITACAIGDDLLQNRDNSSGSGESAGGTDTDPARLVYQENYNLDMNAKGYDEIDIPLNNNQTEQDVLNDLKQKAQAYNGNLPYDPLAIGDGYNSNSFIAGLLNAIGYDGSNLVSSLPGVQPGSDKPVPAHLFE